MASEIRVTNIKANDGTASLTVADSTGALTASGGIANAGTITAGTLGASVNLPSFVGMIAPFAMSTPPTGWLACDGSAISRSTYGDLFTAIGTTWGAGDGSSTFALPDLEGAFLRGTGSHGTSNMADGNDFAGPSVGSFENDQMQSHAHWVGRTSTTNSPTAMAQTAIYLSGSVGGSYGIGETTRTTQYRMIARDIVESDYGTARDGDETRPFNAGVKYCIKY